MFWSDDRGYHPAREPPGCTKHRRQGGRPGRLHQVAGLGDHQPGRSLQRTLPGSDPHLAADIAAVTGRWGPADVVENQDIANGSTQPVQLRAETPHGHDNSPLLGLVSGTYPAGPGQVALTSQVATRYGTHVGGTWRAAGTTWRVTGVVQDPSSLSAMFGDVPLSDVLILLIGLPLIAAVGGWLLAGREPPLIARQPIE